MAGEQYSITLADYNFETSTMSIHTGAVTAVSLPGLLTDIADLKAAVLALTLGNIWADMLRAFKTPGPNSGVAPTDQNAQVERKWLVTYRDNLQFFDAPVNAIPNAGFGKIFNLEIATANAALLTDNSEFLNLTADEGLDFVTAFESIARSPYGGTTEVISIELVGRTR